MTGKEYNNQFSQEELENEIWKDVPDFEGYYQVSNFGRVKGLNRYVNAPNGQRFIKGQIIKGRTSKQHVNHFFVDLKKYGTTYNFYIHRLVLLAFIGPCPEGMECCHADDCGWNNQLKNLRWDTRRNNQFDREKNGKGNKGERQGRHKLIEQDVREIRRLVKEEHFTQRLVASIFNIHHAHVSNIILGKRWSWLE